LELRQKCLKSIQIFGVPRAKPSINRNFSKKVKFFSKYKPLFLLNLF
jgi:hypothetical protein